jgi:hypothetical protein
MDNFFATTTTTSTTTTAAAATRETNCRISLFFILILKSSYSVEKQ